jgi:rhodanese-related sulfurtransferase
MKHTSIVRKSFFRRWVVPAGIGIFLLPSLILSQFTLENIEKQIEEEHRITHLDVSEVKEKISSADSLNYLLFDTREKEEYQKSHVRSAIWIDPDMQANEFIQKYGAQIRGKHLVFYCSVGKRSSIFAEQVNAKVLEGGASSLANLRGGIFRWYNNGYAVFNDAGTTDEIHPYNRYWGQLIKKRTK